MKWKLTIFLSILFAVGVQLGHHFVFGYHSNHHDEMVHHLPYQDQHDEEDNHGFVCSFELGVHLFVPVLALDFDMPDQDINPHFGQLHSLFSFQEPEKDAWEDPPMELPPTSSVRNISLRAPPMA